VRLVHGAGEDDQLGILPPHGAPGIVERAEHRGAEPSRLERRIEPDGGLEVVHRDEDTRSHGRET
jgi:hypothetical protein